MKSKYVKITLIENGTSYIQSVDELHNAISGELDDLDNHPISLKFEAIDMTEEQYNKLPEFMGH